jgi:Ran GTPase-activating protein (RanGAP) involved in mRNA processing and transport
MGSKYFPHVFKYFNVQSFQRLDAEEGEDEAEDREKEVEQLKKKQWEWGEDN